MPFRVGFYVRQQGFLISSTFLCEATGVSIVCTFSKIGVIKLPGAIGSYIHHHRDTEVAQRNRSNQGTTWRPKMIDRASQITLLLPPVCHSSLLSPSTRPSIIR